MDQIPVTPASGALLVACGVGLSITDLRTGRIPNVVTFPMIVVGLLLHALPVSWGLGTGDPWVALLGAAVGFGILFVPFALGLIKAGDVKYLTGIGALGGPWVALFAFLYGSLAHGALCLAVLGRRGETNAAFDNLGYYFRNTVLARRPVDFAARTQGTVPYALGLALGTLAVLVSKWSCGSVFWLWA